MLSEDLKIPFHSISSLDSDDSLLAEMSSDTSRLLAAKVSVVLGGAVALGIVGLAVKHGAVCASAQAVVAAEERVAPLRVELVCSILLVYHSYSSNNRSEISYSKSSRG
jgi:hypothetical protein